MADFHAADLWVAVLPETSQVGPAMEKAGQEAKSRFGAAVKDFGKSIHADLDKVGTHAKDAFGKAGKTAGEIFSSEIGKELTNTAAKEIGKALGEAVRDLPGVARGVELFQQWGSATKIATAGVKGLSDAMHDAKAGDFAGTLEGIDRTLKSAEPVAKLFGADISGWSGGLRDTLNPLQDVQNRTRDIRTGVHDFADTFKGMPGKIGETATALGALVDGPLAAAVAAAMSIDHALHIDSNTFDPGQHGWGHVLFGKTWDWFGGGDPNTGLDKHLTSPGAPPAGPPGVPLTPQNLLGGPPSNSPNSLNDLLFPGATKSTPNTSSPWANSPWFGHGSPAPVPAAPLPAPPIPDIPIPSGSGGGAKVGGSSLSMPSVSSRADLTAAGGRIGNLLAFAKSLVGTPYSQALRNDCSGMVAKLANVALGLPPEASFSTVNEGQWLFSHGFEPGLGGPNDLNIGWWDQGGGNNGHTAATLPGGINAESGGSVGSFALGGRVGASSSQFTQHAHLSMGNFRASSLAGAQIPTGAEHDPLYVTSTGPGGQSGGSPFESQGQQLGQGLINGVLQMFGLDGSVFGGKSPLDFGAVKLGGGLLNWGLGTMRSMASGPMGTPGLGAGGGGGILSGLAGMIPQPGPMVSAAAGPGGSLGIKDAVGGPTSIHNDNRIITTGNTIKDTGELVMRQNWEQNSRAAGYYGGLPAPARS